VTCYAIACFPKLACLSLHNTCIPVSMVYREKAWQAFMTFM
jgi:hypothetical protein